MQDATTIISLEPKNAPAYGTRALAHLLVGNLGEAEKDALKCIELNPKARRPHFIQGIHEIRRFD